MGALAVSLPATVGVSAPPMRPGQRGTGKSRSAAAYARYRISGHPNAPRHWHDRAEFYQSNALKAAVKKRRRKAAKLHWDLLGHNRAHVDQFDNLHDRLNPFYIAK